MSLSTAFRPGKAPAKGPQTSTEREKAQRRRLMGIGGVLVAWLAGWAVFRGTDTLFLSPQDNNGFTRYLLQLRDNVEAAVATNGFLDTVIGGISHAPSTLLCG